MADAVAAVALALTADDEKTLFALKTAVEPKWTLQSAYTRRKALLIRCVNRNFYILLPANFNYEHRAPVSRRRKALVYSFSFSRSHSLPLCLVLGRIKIVLFKAFLIHEMRNFSYILPLLPMAHGLVSSNLITIVVKC